MHFTVSMDLLAFNPSVLQARPLSCALRTQTPPARPRFRRKSSNALHLTTVTLGLNDRFQALDEDGSGSLSTDEMAAPGHTRERMRRSWGGSLEN